MKQGDDFDDAPRRRESPLDTPPIYCTVADCNAPCEQRMVQARNSAQRLVTGAANEFTITSGKHTAMRRGYTFVRWVGRCWDCLLREQLAAGVADWSVGALAAQNVPQLGRQREESLAAYLARCGVSFALPGRERPQQVIDREPGADDDRGEEACTCRLAGICAVCQRWAAQLGAAR